jgi:hypothetical protein
VPPDRQRLVELLPSEWRTVQQYGVEIDSVRYDAAHGQKDVLEPYRNRKSPFRGVIDARGSRADGKWKIKRDPSTNRVWFWACEFDDPTRGTYVPLYYRGQPEAMPFSDKLVAYAKGVLMGRGGCARDATQVMDTLDRIMERIRREQALPVQERRLAAQLALKSFMTGRDYAAAGIDFFSGSTDSTGLAVPVTGTAAPNHPLAGVDHRPSGGEVVSEESAARHIYDPSDVDLLPTADVTAIKGSSDFRVMPGAGMSVHAAVRAALARRIRAR